MIYVYYFFAALLIYFSIKSFRGGIDFLAFFKTELAKPLSDFTPFATIIAPCKGLDEKLAENLAAVMSHDYPAYEVVFVVDDAEDPAVKIIEGISRNPANAARTIVAPRAAISSQKVENLREAVLHADERSGIFVFVDSDVMPGENWLRSLVAPLQDETVGASTGYRWFASEDPTFAAELRSAWNASIASVQGRDTSSNFCWGGSMAIRRDVFEKLRIRDNWLGTLSDDLVVTRCLKAARLPIYFAPEAVVASAGTCTLAGLFEFTNRQIKITRVYAPKLWLMSFLGSGLFNLVMSLSIVILFLGPAGSIRWFAAFLTLASVSFLSIGKAWLRMNAIRMVLPGPESGLDRQFLHQVSLWTLAPTVFFFNCAVASFSRRITWRGTEYEMISPIETRVLQSD